ncbi:dynactin 5 [Fistulifera solaris]|uniref:Dynactin subunit 5 n=1 Tax=Fistulifera solaris TaxID=1519565 RepID=A0A1Z5J6X0_FISSO|nr:dynactin 5 [Fistulifera solaris]|eukprot:GAX09676.1 dynactin 5 [Fistulifera solaris]
MTENDETNDETNDYIVTTTSHCYISRRATLANAAQMELKGRSVIQEGVQLHATRIGRFTHIQSHTTIQAPTAGETLIPVTIGSHTWMGGHVQSHAAAIGSCCHIGDHVRLGERVILKDAVIIAPHVHIPADTVIPPFTYVSANGNWKELPPAILVELQEQCQNYYYHEFRAHKESI